LKISQEPGRRATFQANKTIDLCGKRHINKRLHCCGTTVLSHIISEVGVAGGICDPVKIFPSSLPSPQFSEPKAASIV
jgi:hypothetical protein